MMTLSFPTWNWFSLIPIMPELLMIIAALALLMVGVFQKKPSAYQIGIASIIAVLVTIGCLIGTSFPRVTILNNMVVMDGFARSFKFLILGGLFLSLCLALKDFKEKSFNRFEIPVLMMISSVGMLLMVSSNNLLSLYVSLELQSLVLYVLASVRRDHVSSSEAGLKYFLLGALSSGLLLFGISLIYGYAGSIDFDVLSYTFLQNHMSLSVGVIFGIAFILAGLAFKISAVPFHMWAPDVYQGAPHFVTAFFAIVPKVAAFGLLIRLLMGAFSPVINDWSQIILFLSIASMVVGGFAGIAQSDLKRLFAYSSIGNMGYALMGLLSGTPESIASTILYLTLYMIATAGTFAIFLMIYKNDTHLSPMNRLAGLSKQNPTLAYSFAILLFSIAGIPPFAGFFGKLFVFQSVIEGGFIVTAIVGVIASVISAYYYIRLIKIMFFDEASDTIKIDTCPARVFVLAISLLITIIFIFFPNILLHQAHLAAQNLFGS
jgi:NADH-quinone oxidoreductase subunit N